MRDLVEEGLFIHVVADATVGCFCSIMDYNMY